MEVVVTDGIPKVTLSVYFIQKVLDFNRLCKTRMAFGIMSSIDKDGHIYVEDAYAFPQTAGAYYFYVDKKDVHDILDGKELLNDGYSYAGVGISYKNTSKYFNEGFSEKTAKDFEDAIGGFYNTYLAVQVYDDDVIKVHLVDDDRGFLVKNVDYDIDFSIVGESDDDIKNELKVVRETSYAPYHSSWDDYQPRRTNYVREITPPKKYEDAEINKKNPAFSELV